MLRIMALFSLFVLLVGCASQAVFTVKNSAEPDSVLFYQQQSVSDPLLDAILSDPGDSAEIFIDLLPPPPADTVRLAEGFRVQISAGLDSARAAIMSQKISAVLQDSVYLFKEKGLFKVQTGDFLYRPQADSVQRELTIRSFPGTWVVKRMVIARDSVSAPSQTSKAQDFKYTIQILATTDESRALELISKLQNQFKLPAYYKNMASVFKVFVGKFSNRPDAAKFLKVVRKSGFPDAWIVH